MCKLAICLSVLTSQALLIAPSIAHAATPSATPAATSKDEVALPTDGNLQAAAIASKVWLEDVDNNKYEKSWDEASSITKGTMSRDEWNKMLNKIRKPLGSVKSREVVDLRVATSPKNLPSGEYVVMIYKTAFANKPSTYELVTLFLQGGQWQVVTYQID